MCPRIAYAKVRPGDLVWSCISETKVYRTDEIGEVVAVVGEHELAVLLALEPSGDTMLVLLASSMRVGWTHRLLWERAGLAKEEREWETLDG